MNLEFMQNNAGTLLVLLSFCWCLSCSDDDPVINETDLSSFMPLAIDNYWEFDKYYYKSNGDLFAETDVYWRVDTCCYYIDRIELTPDSADLGRTYLYDAGDGWIYSGGGNKYLSLDYVNKPSDSLYLVAENEGNIPYEHFIRGGLPTIATRFGDRKCIRTLSIYYYQNQRIEQNRWFCKDIGEYQFENVIFEINKNGGPETSYLTSTILRDYSLK